MNIRRTLPVVAATLVAATVAALASSATFFTSIGDLVFPFGVPTPAGQNGTIGDPVRGGMAPVNGNLAYTKVAAATGFSYTFGNFQQWMALRPAGTLAAGYVTMAPSPVDGSVACVSSTQIITSLNLSANTGQTLNDAATSLAANARTCYLYSIGNKTWDRIGD
jgi:hypothetical protein